MTIEELKEIVKDATQQAFDGERISPDEKGATWSIIAGERLWFRTLLDSVESEPIVRCKDCKHRIVNEHYGEKGYMKLKAMCEHDTGDPFERGRCAENDEWFCADGVRMDEVTE